jgi:hypothetical protein
MVSAIIVAGLKFGVPAVAALYSWLGHRRSKRNEEKIAALATKAPSGKAKF